MGMLLTITSIEMFIHHEYSLWADPWSPIIAAAVYFLCWITQVILVELGNAVGIWSLQEERVRRPPRDEDEANAALGLVHSMPDEYRETIAKLKAEHFIDTPRMMEDVFRQRFVKHNRPW
jgi:hypothetical protein